MLLYSSRLIKIVLIHFNSITPIIYISEVDTNLNKGIFLLSLPSFSRGSVIAGLLYLKPSIFLYSQGIKIFIFSSFFIVLVVPMRRISLFSGSIFNLITYAFSFNFKAAGFRTPLILSNRIRTLGLTRFSRLYSRYLIYRLIISIPFFYILFSLIY